jgi:hypothetical protein
MLATADDLGKLIDDSGLDADRATLLLELSTGEVQAVTGQRLVLVEDDPFEMFSFAGPWLELPQRPVSDISSLTLNGGGEITDYKRPAGSAVLWRRCGWASCPDEPSIVGGIYSHGYADDDQRLQFARSASLSVAKLAATNAGGVESESIDDYRVQYAAAVVWAMEQSPYLRKALERTYGPKAGLVRLG